MRHLFASLLLSVAAAPLWADAYPFPLDDPAPEEVTQAQMSAPAAPAPTAPSPLPDATSPVADSANPALPVPDAAASPAPATPATEQAAEQPVEPATAQPSTAQPSTTAPSTTETASPAASTAPVPAAEAQTSPAAPETEALRIGEIVDGCGAGRRDIDHAGVGQRVLKPQARTSLLRGGDITAFTFSATGILHGMALVEYNGSIEIGAQPFDDLLDAGKLLAAIVGP